MAPHHSTHLIGTIISSTNHHPLFSDIFCRWGRQQWCRPHYCVACTWLKESLLWPPGPDGVDHSGKGAEHPHKWLWGVLTCPALLAHAYGYCWVVSRLMAITSSFALGRHVECAAYDANVVLGRNLELTNLLLFFLPPLYFMLSHLTVHPKVHEYD